MAELAAKFPNVMITGDDLTVTNKEILGKSISVKACNAAILKVNQAGSLYDALEFATCKGEWYISHNLTQIWRISGFAHMPYRYCHRLKDAQSWHRGRREGCKIKRDDPHLRAWFNMWHGRVVKIT